MTNKQLREEQIEIYWRQAVALAEALSERIPLARTMVSPSDDRLHDLENKASGLAQALHDIRLLQRMGNW